MALLAKKFKELGSMIKGDDESSQKIIIDHMTALEEISKAIDSLLEEMDDGYDEQVISKRDRKTRFRARLGFKSPKIKTQERYQNSIKNTKTRVSSLSSSLEKMRESIECLPQEESETLGKRIYQLAYPDSKEYSSEKLEKLEARLQNLEEAYLKALEELNTQMSMITEALSDLSNALREQGVVLEGMEAKIEEVDQKLDSTQRTLVEISKKLSSQTILAFLVGMAVGGLVVFLLL
ncbi:MAG: hypothetical protein ACFFCQ_04510 [Promethearchaeota archaeon]